MNTPNQKAGIGPGDPLERTIVIDRVVIPEGPAVRRTSARARVVATVTPKGVYCPSCTFGNPVGATKCKRCGVPMDVSGHVEAYRAESRTPAAVYALTGSVVVLMAAVLYLLVSR
ncbi:MAG: zinc finger Ran-binding domain-containing protein [Bryobacteraceae bacterium]|nr:zinc finger Ran-binding domain-containing protein [Bryobacteraceae bacterium]